ncbi:MAG: transcriptional regulator, MarR family [Actinomycetia bacterium]|nr:transcriptional regulator, MarR family [Actinomycetes bacterium]
MIANANIPAFEGRYDSEVGETDEIPWLDESEQRVWRSLIGATGELMATLDAELQAAHGLSGADYEVLVNLSEAPDRRMRMTDLAIALHLSPSGLTRRLDVLARRGWVRRERCPSDRRGTFAVLTDDGYEQIVQAAPTHVRGVREHFINRLTPRQLANLGAALSIVAPDGGRGVAACAEAHEGAKPSRRR